MDAVGRMDSRTRYRQQSPPRRQRACVPCTKARARCHFQSVNIDKHLCDRCERMALECTAKTTRSLRKPRQIRGVETDVQDRGHREGDVGILPPFALRLSSESSIPKQYPESETNNAVSASQNPPARRALRQDSPSAGLEPQISDEHPPLGLSWLQASRILSMFRSQYMSNFPFVTIDSQITPQQLYGEKPFLFRAVMLVAAPLPEPRIAKMKRDVLAYLGQQVLVEEKVKRELLQGLLLIIAWGHKCHVHDDQVTNLAHLALGYAHNLGLTRIPSGLLQSTDKESPPQDARHEPQIDDEKSHSPEEQKAFLGTFCLLSANAIQHTRRNPLESPYVDICCKSLTTTFSSTNLLLERTVRMIQMSEKLSRAFGESHERTHARPYAFLLEGSGRGFRTELNRIIETAMHPDLEAHKSFFHLWLNYLFVRVYEPATRVKEHEAEGVGPSMYRSLCLRNCLAAAKEYFEILLSEPATEVLYLTLLTSEQTAFVMLLTARLLLIDAPDWDASLARLTLDLIPILDKILERTQEADAARRQAVENFAKETGVMFTEEEMQVESHLAETARKTKWLKESFQARLDGREDGSLEVEGEMIGTVAGSGGEEQRGAWVNGIVVSTNWCF